VQDVKYRWRATGNDDFISLVIWPADLPGAAIVSMLGYHQVPVPRGDGSARLTQQIVITNRIVRQVIEHAVRAFGYDPHTKGKELDLRNVDESIDLSAAIRSA
jgi:hypothetical protein